MSADRVLIVDAAHQSIAAAQFPSLLVLGNKPTDEATLSFKAGTLAGKTVYLWCHYAALLAEDLAPTVADLGIVNGEKTPMSFRGRGEAIAYLKANVRRYRPPASKSDPWATPDNIAPPEGVQAVAEAPKPTATVTPITEARTKQQAKAQPDAESLPVQFSHDALAQSFSTANPDLRYVAEWGKWLCWNGTYWAHDTTHSVRELSRLVCRHAATDAKARDIAASTIRTILSVTTIGAVETIARSDPLHARSSEQWDADPWILNTPGGIVDLTDGSIRPGRPQDHQTRITRATPSADAQCPTWVNFLIAATKGDGDLIGFLQRMAGYCLTGSIRDHALFFVHGPGGNGKGTFLNTLTWILGDYAGVAAMDTFTEQHQPQHKTELASLMGRRLVSAQEVEEGKRWAEARINSLTGGDPITANFMRQDLFTFMPQFKLVVVGNHKPLFRNVGDAIRRRLYLIPFTHKVEEKDKDTQLADKLRAEAAGILRWAVAGCIAWQRDGLQAPEIVRAATDDYLVSQDVLATWVAECCETDPLYRCATGNVYKSYKQWADSNGEGALGRKRFVEALGTRGYVSEQTGGTYWIKGLRVRVDTTAHDSRFPDN